jgi:hypothetical protein
MVRALPEDGVLPAVMVVEVISDELAACGVDSAAAQLSADDARVGLAAATHRTLVNWNRRGRADGKATWASRTAAGGCARSC